MATYRVADLDTFEYQRPVKSILNDPSSLTPSKGDRYLVGTSGVGDWSGHSNQITYYDGSDWQFITVVEGQLVWVQDENLYYFYTGAVWEDLTASGPVGSYSDTFTNADLSSNVLTVVHNLGVTECLVQVFDNSSQKVNPSEITLVSTTTLTVDFTGLTPLSGTWTIIVLSTGTNNGRVESVLDTDLDTGIDVERTADEDKIRFKIGGVDQILLEDGVLRPIVDEDIDLGSTSYKFKDLYLKATSIHLGTNTLSVEGDTLKLDGNPITGAVSLARVQKAEDNIMLNAFRLQVQNSLGVLNYVDGFSDEYEDETGVDTGTSTNEVYDSTNDLYYPDRVLAGIDSNVTLMFHGDAINNSKAFIDSGNVGYIISTAGDAITSTTQKKFGSTAYKGDGSGDTVYAPTATSWNFQDGSSWAIDFWVYFNSIPGDWYIITSRGLTAPPYTGWMIGLNPSGYLGMYNAPDGSARIQWASSLTTSQWYHVEISHDDTGNLLYLFVNGDLKSSVTASTAITWGTSSEPLSIGSQGVGGGRCINGYIDEYRISSIARHTSSFTPETSAYTSDSNTLLLLHMDTLDVSNSHHGLKFYSNAKMSTSQSKFGGSSLYLDSSSSYVTAIDSVTDFDFGTGDFTIDWWEYRVATSGVSLARAANMGICGFVVGYDSNLIYMSSNNSSWDIASGKTLGTQSLNTWVHYAIVRSGTTFYTFKNGVQSDTWTSSSAIATTANPFSIGAFDISGGGPRYLNGYIEELRVSKGVARWTSGFTPPTAAYGTDDILYNMTLVSISNTAVSVPTSARIVLLEEDVDTIVLNTELKAYVSRNSGTSWTQVTLADIGDYDLSRRVLAGSVDVSGQSSGTSMKYKIETIGVDLKLHATALAWD